MRHPIPPSGSQFEIRQGGQRAVIVEVGGGIREYGVDGIAILDGYPADEMCRGGRGQILAPWPNRIDGGRYRWRDTDMQLALTEPARGNANHGLVRWANWTLDDRQRDSVTMSYILYPQPGYPFILGLRAEYRLDTNGLTVTFVATNLGDEPLPFGLGSHPYLSVDTSFVDEATLVLDASARIETDERGIPTGRIVDVAGTEHELSARRPIGARVLDDCYTQIARDADGYARAILENADRTRRVALWMDETFRYVMVFTGDTLAEAERRRSVAVEPMTCPPNAFASGEDLIVLDPGVAHTFRWGIAPG